MTGTPAGPRRLLARHARLALAASLVLVACGREGDRPAERPAATQAARPLVDSARGAGLPPADSILAAGRAASYDTSVAADTTFEGARLRLHPELRSYAARDELARGRIVGRLVNLDTVPVPRFALGARDTAYWWVDSTAAGWRATFVSARTGSPSVRRLVIGSHPNERHLAPAARWEAAEGGVLGPWVPCGTGACCKPT